MKVPSHKTIINQYLNWDLVEERLRRYKNINKYFPLNELKSCLDTSPYYCHYLSWRLGTWENEELFEFFDSLLFEAEQLSNWDRDRIYKGCEFENFWSLIWELQVAKLFSFQLKGKVEWTKSGPDLKVDLDGNTFFVECTVYRKSFGLEEFISELIKPIHPWLKVSHRPFNKFSLPKNNLIDLFLDELLEPVMDPIYLKEKIMESYNISPIVLSNSKEIENIHIFIENPHRAENNFDQPWMGTGLPEGFLDTAVREALNNKRKSNELKVHRPNLLLVNFLLGTDYQLGKALRNIPSPNLGEEFDAVVLTECGIDEIPSLDKRDVYFNGFDNNHPIKGFLN